MPDDKPQFDPPQSADRVVESFDAAKEENALDRYRTGQIVYLPADHEVWMPGDLHDHRTNFRKLIDAANLAEHPTRHLILHELIHGDHFDASGAEDSWHMLFEAAELKLDFPDQVHFLFANHDLAQIHGDGIVKAGLGVCEAFNAGIKRDFAGHEMIVQLAITEFLLSLPLAVKCPNGLWFSHSLPSDDDIANFDYEVFARSPLTAADYKRLTGPVYQLIWGRKYTPIGAALFAEKVGATLLVTGHQPQEMGHGVVGERVLIVDSSHNHGMVLTISTSQAYDLATLAAKLQPIAGLGWETQSD